MPNAKPPNTRLFIRQLPCRRLHGLSNTISLAGIDGLAGLLDLLQHRLVGQRVLGRDVCGLRLQRDVVFLDTWGGNKVSEKGNKR